MLATMLFSLNGCYAFAFSPFEEDEMFESDLKWRTWAFPCFDAIYLPPLTGFDAYPFKLRVRSELTLLTGFAPVPLWRFKAAAFLE